MTVVLFGTAMSAAMSAEPLNTEKINQVVRLFEVVAKFPPPSWQKTMDPFAESEYFRGQKGPTIVLEQIPKGQTFDHWNKLYAVYALFKENLPFGTFTDQSLGVFSIACGNENLAVSVVEKAENSTLMVIFCENSPNGPANFGYGDGVGEITVMAVRKVSDTFVKVYQHWRGDKFDVSRPDSWPVSRAEVEEMLRRFRSIILTYDCSSGRCPKKSK